MKDGEPGSLRWAGRRAIGSCRRVACRPHQARPGEDRNMLALRDCGEQWQYHGHDAQPDRGDYSGLELFSRGVEFSIRGP